jgi:hypothetical protein
MLQVQDIKNEKEIIESRHQELLQLKMYIANNIYLNINNLFN